ARTRRRRRIAAKRRGRCSTAGGGRTAMKVLRLLSLAVVVSAAVLGAASIALRHEHGPVASAATSSRRDQCSMQPQIVSDEPGTCPICEMPLQRVADDPEAATSPAAAAPPTAATAESKPIFYRHPMRPDVTSPAPAKDEMGMDY